MTAERRTVTAGAGSGFTVTPCSSNTTAAWGQFLLVNATSASVTITLPTAVGNSGSEIIVKRVDSLADTSKTVTINTTSSQTIETGTGTYILNGRNEVAHFLSDGANIQQVNQKMNEERKIIMDPVWGVATNDDSTNSGAAFESALASFNITGTRVGGILEVPGGDYYVDRPLVLRNNVRLVGSGSWTGTILRAHSTFPVMTLNNGGTLTLPTYTDNSGAPSSFTVTVTTMDAKMPTTGGVITLDTSLGYASLVYETISGNSFQTCRIRDSLFSGATVTDGTTVSTFMACLGHPSDDTDGVYGTRLEDIVFDGSTTGTSGAQQAAGTPAGLSGVFSNRVQEHGGARDLKIRNFKRYGMHYAQAPTSQFHQDWYVRGLTASPCADATASTVSWKIDGNVSTIRGADDMSFAAVGLVDTPAIAIQAKGITGDFRSILVERHKTCFHITSDERSGTTSAQTSCMGIVVSGLHGYGAAGTTMTEIIKIDASRNASVALHAIRKISAPSASLVLDTVNSVTLTDNSLGHYSFGQKDTAGNRQLLTDAGSYRSVFTQGLGLTAPVGKTLGNVTRKVKAYNEAGTLIGYIPVYDNITVPAISLVQDDIAHNGRDNSSGTTLTLTVTTPTTLGNMILVAGAQTNTGQLTSVTDSKSNTYTITNGGGGFTSSLAVAPNATALAISDTIVLTYDVAGNWAAGIASEWAGVYPLTNAIDQHNAASGTSTSPNSGTSGTRSQSNQLVMGVVGAPSGGTHTAGAGYTSLTSVTSGATNHIVFPSYKITANTTAETVSGTLGTSQTWTCLVAAINSV